MVNKFLKDKHNIELFSGESPNLNSLIHPNSISGISAAIYNSGTAITQGSGALPGIYAHLPEYSAAMVPSAGTHPTGWTNHFFVALANTPNAHIMSFAGETTSAYFSDGYWKIEE